MPAHQLARPSMSRLARLPGSYFERLVESSPDIVIAVDRTGTIIYYNDGAETLLGAVVVVDDRAGAIDGNDDVRRALDQPFEIRARQACETRHGRSGELVRRHGESVWVGKSGRP